MINKLLFLLVVFVAFTACSPQKRLNCLLRHHPELMTKDTVKYTDTVVLKSTKIDTSFLISTLLSYDTITLIKDSLKIQIEYKDKKIYLQAENKGGEMLIPKKIIIDQVNYNPVIKKTSFWDNLKMIGYVSLFWLVICFVVFIITRLRL